MTCAGELIGGMGMSEPNAGTDVLGLRSKAVRDGDDYVRSGRGRLPSASLLYQQLPHLIRSPLEGLRCCRALRVTDSPL